MLRASSIGGIAKSSTPAGTGYFRDDGSSPSWTSESGVRTTHVVTSPASEFHSPEQRCQPPFFSYSCHRRIATLGAAFLWRRPVPTPRPAEMSDPSAGPRGNAVTLHLLDQALAAQAEGPGRLLLIALAIVQGGRDQPAFQGFHGFLQGLRSAGR